MSLEKQSHPDGQTWVTELLKLMALPTSVNLELHADLLASNQNTAEKSSSSASYWLTIDASPLTPNQVQTLIGPHGSVLDAIQYLANTILNMGQPSDEQHAYTIELDGYRVQRQAELQAMANEAAEQVRSTGKEFELKALSSAERRQVHMFLQSHPDLETFSRGYEPDRRLVVRPLQPQAEDL